MDSMNMYTKFVHNGDQQLNTLVTIFYTLLHVENSLTSLRLDPSHSTLGQNKLHFYNFRCLRSHVEPRAPSAE
jgi:hypothetical protein